MLGVDTPKFFEKEYAQALREFNRRMDQNLAFKTANEITKIKKAFAFYYSELTNMISQIEIFYWLGLIDLVYIFEHFIREWEQEQEEIAEQEQ